jgi:protein CpxP
MAPTRLLTIAVIGLLLLNFGLLSFLFWQKPNRHPHGHPAHRPQKEIVHRLSLDEAQQQAYQALIERHKDSVEVLETEIRDTKKLLYTKLQSQGGTEAGETDSLLARLGAIQVRIEQNHFQHFSALRGICRADQLAAFDELSLDLARIFDRKHPGRPPHHPQ